MWNTLPGYVIIRIEGHNTEQFINCAVQRAVCPSNVQRIAKNAILARIRAKDFAVLRLVSRETHCTVHICRKSGLRFYTAPLRRRPVLAFGFVMVLIALLMLAQRVSVVQVDGCFRVSEAAVMEAVASGGYFRGISVHKLDTAAIAAKVRQSDTRIVRASVSVSGVKLLVTVNEADLPENSTESTEPRSLYAGKDAVVVSIVARSGKACVRAGDVVRKGDVLINGNLSTAEKEILVRAEGTVIGHVGYSISATAGPMLEKLVRSGNSKSITVCDIGGRRLFSAPYPDYELQYGKAEELHNCFLPMRFIHATCHELTMCAVTGTASELESVAAMLADRKLRAQLTEGTRVLSKFSTAKVNSNGSVTVTITVTTEENICE